ncbi:MAG: hypothetical protein WC623_24415 [Pedobacter sp.]|uniref:hypothetical protein n=1 Tax=Pedobacter sp. TaxID=1411316 RepID=UPI003567847B
MSKIETKIVISGDATGAKKAFGDVNSTLKKAQGNITSFVSAHKVAIAALAAGVAAGMATMAWAITKATKAAIEQEEAETKLRGAMLATGTYSVKVHQSWVNYAGQLQKVTTYQDENIISAMGMIQQFAKLNDEQMKKLIPSVLDLSTALGMDLDSASKMVGKTLSGSINAFARYGIEVDMSGTASERLASLTEALNSKFKGQAELMRGTFAGSLTGIKIAYGEIWETAGKAITQNTAALQGMVAVEKLFWGLTEVVDKNQIAIRGMAQNGVGLLVNGIMLAVRGVLGLKAAWGECATIFWKAQGIALDGLVLYDKMVYKMAKAMGSSNLETLMATWDAHTKMALEVKAAASENWKGVQQTGQTIIDLEKMVDQYNKTVGKISKTGNTITPPRIVTPTGEVETVGGGGGGTTADAQKVSDKKIEIKSNEMDLIEAFNRKAEDDHDKSMAAEIKSIQDFEKINEEADKKIAERKAKRAEDEQKQLEVAALRWTAYQNIIETSMLQAFETARQTGESFFSAFAKGLAKSIKQYLMAEQVKIIATQVTELAKAFITAPLTFGATLAAVGPIIAASVAGIAALQALVPNLADGGIVRARPGGTLVNVAEAGRDEMVIPLGKGGIGGGGVNYYTFNISSNIDLAQVTTAIQRGNPSAINMVKAINRTGSKVGGEA